MNQWPDELWANERSRMWATLDRYVKDAGVEIDLFPCTTDENVLKAATGLLLTSCFCVVMVSLVATAGWSTTRKLLKQRASQSLLGATRG